MVGRSVRAAIASATAIPILFVLAPSTNALTCAEERWTLSDAYEAADSIVVGLITECKEEVSSEPYATGGADCSFTSVEVLKDSIPARDYTGVASSSGCGLSVNVGSQYLLFLDSQNRPMAPSEPLSGDHYQTRRASRYIEILRDFRDGQVDDLAEPWMFEKSQGYCFIRQRIKGHEISFSRRTPDAPPGPKPEWVRETIDGETVYRTTVPLMGSENRVSVGDAEIVSFNDVAPYDGNTLFFRVSLQDSSPATLRQGSVTVGNNTWPLNRVETNLRLLADQSTHKLVEYWAAGASADQILSAMIEPSEIAVSATIVSPNIASSISDAAPSDEVSAETPLVTGDFVGQTRPISRASSPSANLNVRAAGSYTVQEEPPELTLRLESRSTQLSGAIKSFRTCSQEISHKRPNPE